MDVNTTPYYHLPLLSLDTETTGIDIFNDRIVTCNITYDFVDGREPIVCDWLINPGVHIAEGATEVHGITNEIAQQYGRHPKEVLTEIANHLNSWAVAELPIVIYNAPFDISLLIAEFLRYGVPCQARFDRVIDPLVLDKALDPYRKGSRKLTPTAEHYGIDLVNAHSADADAMAAVKVARKLGDFYEIDDPVRVVHDAQIDLFYKQMVSLEKHFKKTKDPNTVLDKQWPYRLQ